MKVKIITGSDPKAKEKISEILDIYNTTSGHDESFSNTYPEKCRIAYYDGVAGGVIFETIFKGYVLIYFAGFEMSERRKGRLKACIDAMGSKMTVVGSQVNPFDNTDVWNNLGFIHQITINYTITLLNIEPLAFKRLYNSLPNNQQF